MPAGPYDFWLGQMNLYDPTVLPLDAEISRFVRSYRGTPGPVRHQLRRSMDLADATTLLTFARRSAVFAMRQESAETLADGLAACAAIENEQFDDRDILVAIALLYHAATRAGVRADVAVGEAATLACAPVGRLMEGFLTRSSVEQDLRLAWGHVEAAAPGGVGLLQWGFRPWLPTLDIAGASVSIASAISADAYQADDPTLAVELPEVWLSEARDPNLGPILGSSRGAALVHGRLRPGSSEQHDSQQLSIWVVEASSAAQLRAMTSHPRPHTATLGVSVGALFALAIGRSFVNGVPSFESGSSLARFESAIEKALVAADEQRRRRR